MRGVVDEALDVDLAIQGLVRFSGSRPRAVSLVSPTLIGMPSVSNPVSASSVT